MSTKKAARRSRTAAGWSEAKAGTVTLNDAAMDGDCDTITGMLDSGLDVNALIETADKSGKCVATTALHWAVTYNQAAAARLLLDRGANPNLARSDGGTPLMEAAAKGFAPIVRLLLEAKADIDAVCPTTGFTAFHYACFYGAPRAVE
eukprot:COSAG04_NODE_6794_length_1254_cov_0.816450_2_plen_147_part_01